MRTGYGAHAETVASGAGADVVSRGRRDHGRVQPVLPAAESQRGASQRCASAFCAPTDPPLERVYTLPADVADQHLGQPGTVSRAWARARSAEVSAVIESLNAQPIVVERAMYLDTAGQSFAAGHGSAAGDVPCARVVLRRRAPRAPGSTCSCSSPIRRADRRGRRGDVPAARRRHDRETPCVPARRRYTIWVDQEEARLSDTAYRPSCAWSTASRWSPNARCGGPATGRPGTKRTPRLASWPRPDDGPWRKAKWVARGMSTRTADRQHVADVGRCRRHPPVRG